VEKKHLQNNSKWPTTIFKTTFHLIVLSHPGKDHEVFQFLSSSTSRVHHRSKALVTLLRLDRPEILNKLRLTNYERTLGFIFMQELSS